MKRIVINMVSFLKNLRNLSDFDVISVQMGKVGSTSILRSYPKSYQGHSWDATLPDKYFSSNFSQSFFGYTLSLFRWKIKFFVAQRRLKLAEKNKIKIKLLIGVRDPVSRNISGYFQSLNYRERDVDVESHILKYKCFVPHMTPLHWLENEIDRNFGINVYDRPFDRDKGFIEFEEGNFKVFLYKLEKLPSLENDLGDFLSEPSFKLVNANVGSQNWYGKLYESFHEKIEFSQEYLDLLYNSKYVNHFYSQAEIAQFRAKWTKELPH